MARLRIRVELSRSGQGVPLQKLAHVIDESLKFFQMLGEDAGIGPENGEWVGIDFDRDSLNFTAEFVGQVTREQVEAFHAGFAGTTSLRRTTIAQFARITESINEDELVGFGLYQSDEVNEPTEWRCISRRDALRISEEIAMLAGDDSSQEYGTHLPAVRDQNLVARIFGERHSRGLEQARWVDYVREIETNLSARLTNVENAVQKHTGLLEDLHARTATTEESFRNLLSAVENFCNQAAKQIERIPQMTLPPPQPAYEPPPPAPVAQASGAAAAPALERNYAPNYAPPVVKASPIPSYQAAYYTETGKQTDKRAERAKGPGLRMSIANLLADIPRNWLLGSAGVGIGAAVVLVALWVWSIPTPVVIGPGPSAVSASSTPQLPAPPNVNGERSMEALATAVQSVGTQPAITSPGINGIANAIQKGATPPAQPVPLPPVAAAPGSVATVPATAPAAAPSPALSSSPAAQTVAAGIAALSSPSAPTMLLDLDVTEPTWVSLRDATGKQLLAQLLNPGESRTLRVATPAVLRAGNAGGLSIKVDGKPQGLMGPHGGIREVELKDGAMVPRLTQVVGQTVSR